MPQSQWVDFFCAKLYSMAEGLPIPPPADAAKPPVARDTGLQEGAARHIVEVGTDANILKDSLHRAADSGIDGVGDFLAEFEALQRKYPNLFPSEQPIPAKASIDESGAGQAAVISADIPVAAASAVDTQVASTDTRQMSDEELAESYPVTDQTEEIIAELQKLAEERWSTSADSNSIGQKKEALIRQLSDVLALPAGLNVATLEQEAARFEEIKYDTITSWQLVDGLSRFSDKNLEPIIAQGTPTLQAAYQEYKSSVATLGRDDFDKRRIAGKAFEEAWDAEAGITPEDAEQANRAVGVYMPYEAEYGSAQRVQPIIIQSIWKEIRNAQAAQSVYARRSKFLRDLAAKAGVEVYKGQLEYRTRPITASEGAPRVGVGATAEDARALVEEAMRLVSDNKGEYDDPNLTSREITERTLSQGLADAPGLVVDRTERGEVGKGVVGTVFTGRAKGGVDGLQGRPATSEVLPVAVKATALGSGRIDHSEAKNILGTIEEAHTLEAIRREQQRLYPGSMPLVVDSVLLQNYRGVPALIMEYVNPRDGLWRQNDTLTPQQLKSACVQYFKLLDVIHNAGFTCNDKKGGDIFYLADEDRLIVLDWNVTEPISTPPEQENIRAMNADLLIGLEMFRKVLQKRSPEIDKVFKSFEQRIYDSVSADLVFDVDEIIRALEALQV